MIRNALITDLDDIEKIEKAAFKEPWSRVSLEAEFYKDYSRIFICEKNGNFVGYIIIWDLGIEAEIVTFAVTEEYRGKGIGSYILNWVIGKFSSASVWRLEVACDNIPAISLYEKYGFVKTGRIKDYYGEGENAYRMIRSSKNM